MEVKVLLNSIEKVKNFVVVARSIDCDIDLIGGRNVYLDAKSLMGILSCNVSKPLILDIHADELETKHIIKKFAEFIYDEENIDDADRSLVS